MGMGNLDEIPQVKVAASVGFVEENCDAPGIKFIILRVLYDIRGEGCLRGAARQPKRVIHGAQGFFGDILQQQAFQRGLVFVAQFPRKKEVG